MIKAAKISSKLNHLKKSEVTDIIEHLKKVGLPHYSSIIKSKKFYTTLLNDKKNNNNIINLVLLKKIVKAYFKRGLNIKEYKKLVN